MQQYVFYYFFYLCFQFIDRSNWSVTIWFAIMSFITYDWIQKNQSMAIYILSFQNCTGTSTKTINRDTRTITSVSTFQNSTSEGDQITRLFTTKTFLRIIRCIIHEKSLSEPTCTIKIIIAWLGSMHFDETTFSHKQLVWLCCICSW